MDSAKLEDFLKNLDRVKTLDITVKDLQDKFFDFIQFRKKENEFSLTRSYKYKDVNKKIVSSLDMESAILKKIHGKINVDELQAWANFVLMMDEFKISEAESKDQQERIKTILHQIATPEIHSELTDAIIQYYLNCLKQQCDVEL